MARSSSAPAPDAPSISHLVLPGDRDPTVVAFEGQVVDFFVDAADLLGVPKSVAAIYGIVFASPEPLSFAEIEARLDISKGSISQGLRVLREVGALKEVSADADRAELFTPDLEMRKLASRFLEKRLEQQLEARQHPPDDPATGVADRPLRRCRRAAQAPEFIARLASQGPRSAAHRQGISQARCLVGPGRPHGRQPYTQSAPGRSSQRSDGAKLCQRNGQSFASQGRRSAEGEEGRLALELAPEFKCRGDRCRCCGVATGTSWVTQPRGSLDAGHYLPV